MRYGYIILGVIVLLILIGAGIAVARNGSGYTAAANGCPLAQRPVYQTASAINTVRPATCPTAYQASALGTLGYAPQTYANPYISSAYTTGSYQPLMPMVWYSAPSQGQYYYTATVPTTARTVTTAQNPALNYQYNYQYQYQNQIPGQTQYYNYQYGTPIQGQQGTGIPVQQGGMTWYQ